MAVTRQILVPEGAVGLRINYAARGAGELDTAPALCPTREEHAVAGRTAPPEEKHPAGDNGLGHGLVTVALLSKAEGKVIEGFSHGDCRPLRQRSSFGEAVVWGTDTAATESAARGQGSGPPLAQLAIDCNAPSVEAFRKLQRAFVSVEFMAERADIFSSQFLNSSHCAELPAAA